MILRGGAIVIKVKCALISVSDKRGIVEFARGLVGLGIELLASDGTAKLLRSNQIKVQSISEYTGASELLGGRVKTLHPAIHAGILAKREETHLAELQRHNMNPIDLVVVNLYPFESLVRLERPSISASMEEAMEYVDIGGEALIRAAAKNHKYVGVVVDPEDYEPVLKELKSGGLSAESSKRLAEKAFHYATRYNAAIANFFAKEDLPEQLTLCFDKALDLRYGENPHQKAALYANKRIKQLQGKDLSYTNLLDLDAALRIVRAFEKPTAVIIKHTNPCGLACADELAKAFERAFGADEKSAFGGIIGLNRTLDEATAALIKEHFFEAVIAPDYSREALEILKAKKNLRLMQWAMSDTPLMGVEVRATTFGLLAQTPDDSHIRAEDLKVVTRKAPTPEQIKDLLFAWKAVRFVKSNAIVLAKDETTVGIGAGQMSRVDSVELALKKAGECAKGSVMASDAFFPFRDSIDIAAQAGICAIIQPGGSVKDEEVIAAANEHGIPMVFTGVRVFRH